MLLLFFNLWINYFYFLLEIKLFEVLLHENFRFVFFGLLFFFFFFLPPLSLPPPPFPGSIFWRRAPLLQVLHTPPLPRTVELQDGKDQPRESGGGRDSSHSRFRGAPAPLLPGFAAHPSQCLWAVSPPGVMWAFEAYLRKKKAKAVKETVHKDTAEDLIIAI